MCESRGTCIERDLRCLDECDDAEDDESVDDARGVLLLLCNESFGGGGGIVGFVCLFCDVTFNGSVSEDVSWNVLGGVIWRLCNEETDVICTSSVSDAGTASLRDIVSVFSQTSRILAAVVRLTYSSSPLAKMASSL